jgi:hypothetical protein
MALWRARDVEVWLTSASASSAATFTSGTNYASIFKSCEFKEPERNTGEQKLLGATGGLANSEIWEEDPTMGELSGELLLTPTNGATLDIANLFYTFTSSGGVYQTSYASDPANPSMYIKFASGGVYTGFILQDVTLNTLGGTKVDADGHASANLKVSVAANKCWKVKSVA